MLRYKARRLFASVLVGVGLSALVVTAAHAADGESEKTVIDEVLAVLKQRGDIAEEDYQRLVAKNAAAEKKEKSLLPTFRFFGDLRGRMEGAWYRKDPVSDRPNRFSGRYRARLGASAEVNPYVTAVLRLASGEGNSRSSNTSFGDKVDFAPDSVFIDWAYLQLRPIQPDQMPVEGGKLDILWGKQPNPFLWTQTPDLMLWDNDITPEGGAVTIAAQPLDTMRVFANAGYFVIQENSGFSGGANTVSSDPHVIGAQVGSELRPFEEVSLGWRGAWYGFRSLNQSFFQRGVNGSGGVTSSGGNISLSEGVTVNPAGTAVVSGDPVVNVGELSMYLSWRGFDEWPITVWGKYALNFNAGSIPSIGGDKQDKAWGVGGEVGDKTKWIRLGVGYYHIEADSFPSQYIDSDLFDGLTDRQGWDFTAVRQIFKNTDLRLELFWDHYIEGQLPVFATGVSGSERIRVRTDLEVKF